MMRFCTKCGKERQQQEKFCIHCGTAFTEEAKPQSAPGYTPPPAPQVSKPQSAPGSGSASSPPGEQPAKTTSGPPTWFWAAGLAVLVTVAGIAVYSLLGNDKPSPTPMPTPTPTRQSTPAPTVSAPNTPAPIMDLRIDHIDTSGYPQLLLDISAANADHLAAGDLQIYDGEQLVTVQSLQKSGADGARSRYRVEVTAANPPDGALDKTLRAASGDLTSEFTYEIPYERTPATLQVHQIDATNYPEISVYFTLQDPSGEYVLSNDARFLNILDDSGAVSAHTIIKSLRTTQEDSRVNIALVLDRSGSMEGPNFITAKETAIYFLQLLNYAKGDGAAVISFDTYVYLDHFFSGDNQSLTNAIRNMYTAGLTALYDALHVALLEASNQSGAKCVVALTDGMDNSSGVTPGIVIETAKELNIPIYIIALGYDDFSNARLIAEESGGYFMNITSISEIQAIYDRIMREQQQQMVLTFTVDESVSQTQTIGLQFKDTRHVAAVTVPFSYQNIINPNINQSDISANIQYMSDVEKAMYYYQHQFVKAVNAYDFDLLKDAIDPNGGLYEMQRGLIDDYRKIQVKERLLYYKINSLRALDDGSYEAVVTEQFYIQIGDKQASYKEFENTYIIRPTSGGYKVSELTKVNTIGQSSVNINLS